jgi:polyhydroxybutyrate depolymerase
MQYVLRMAHEKYINPRGARSGTHQKERVFANYCHNAYSSIRVNGGCMKPFGSKSTLLFTVMATVILNLGPHASAVADGVTEANYGGRSLLIFVPSQLPEKPALVVVLHGALGNAQRIESERSEHGLNMDAVAAKERFIVAYLNGTPVTRRMGADKLGWNAGGGCCGLSAARNVDDVRYIQGAVDYLASRYGIDRGRVYGIGHSNGAMMTQRVLCETGTYAAAVAISGPLNLDTTSCPGARGKRILAIHGADDANVPIAGGQGTEGLSRASYKSEDRSRQIFASSGAIYSLQIVPGADHKLDNIGAVIQQTEGVSIAQKAAEFFGLAAKR